MLQFVRQKIKNKKWLNLCLLAGFSLLVAVFTCHPMFERGSGNQLLQTAFEDHAAEKKEFPAAIGREENYEIEEYKNTQAIYDRMDAFEKKWLEYIDIDAVESSQALLINGTSTSNFRSSKRFLKIGCIRDMDMHTQVVKGTSVSDSKGKEGVFPCVISERVMDSYGMVVGEELNVYPSSSRHSEPAQFIVVGIIQQGSYSDNFWNRSLDEYEKTIFVSEETMNTLMADYTFSSVTGSQQLLLDYPQIDGGRASEYRGYLEQFLKADELVTTNFLEILKSFEKQQESVKSVLTILELPCIVLLLLFIYMVSSQILGSEEGEIAVLRSRGVTRKQIMLLYLLQSFLLSVAGIFCGVLLGYGMCKCAASTDAFLLFVRKDVSLYRFTWWMLPYAGIACLIAILFMTLPVLKRAKLTIVEQKSMNHYGSKKPIWEKFFLDIILLCVSSYLLYNYNKQKEELAFRMISGESMDPLVFLDASLFLFACGLVFLRLTGYLIAGVDRLGKKRWKPAIYASFLQIRRTFYRQGFLSIFLIMTISGGIYDANMARTMNENNEQRVSYDVGTDIRMQDKWTLDILKTPDGNYHWSYKEPDYEPYKKLEEMGLCEKVTRVIEDNRVDIETKSTVLTSCELLGIHTKEFGETASLLDGLNEEHWFHALNALAENADGVIISQSVAEALGLSVGDSVRYTRYNPIQNQAEEKIDTVKGTVCAIVEAFPGYDRYQYIQDEDGEIVLQEKHLIIANYATVVGYFGLTPYSVWMRRTSGTSDEQIAAYLEEKEIEVTKWTSADELVAKSRNEAMIQVTNGMFTMSFLISILICSVGFLIYWIMSMKNRELLFGIYRAMGMPMRDINKMLLNEQIFGSLLPILAGGGAGMLGTVLFAKLIALVYLPKKHNIGIRIFVYGGDMVKLFAVVLLVVLVCFFVIRKLLSGMKIAEALKLGED